MPTGLDLSTYVSPWANVDAVGFPRPPRFCARCQVGWRGSDPCWVCGLHPGQPFPEVQ